LLTDCKGQQGAGIYLKKERGKRVAKGGRQTENRVEEKNVRKG